jgi:peptidoglycan hydrolase-like protein with peptidoglycan-binding domain
MSALSEFNAYIGSVYKAGPPNSTSQKPASAQASQPDPWASTSATSPAPAKPPADPRQQKAIGIQKALQMAGYNPGPIDGNMGPQTVAAIKKLQQANGLPADRCLNQPTQAALAKEMKAKGAAPIVGRADGAEATAGAAKSAGSTTATTPGAVTAGNASKFAAASVAPGPAGVEPAGGEVCERAVDDPSQPPVCELSDDNKAEDERTLSLTASLQTVNKIGFTDGSETGRPIHRRQFLNAKKAMPELAQALNAYDAGFKDGKAARVKRAVMEKIGAAATEEGAFADKDFMLAYDAGYDDGRAGKDNADKFAQRGAGELAAYNLGQRDGEAVARLLTGAYKVGFADGKTGSAKHRSELESSSEDAEIPELLTSYDNGFGAGEQAAVKLDVQVPDPNKPQPPQTDSISEDQVEADRKYTEEMEFLKQWLDDAPEQHPPHDEHRPHEHGGPEYTEENHVQRPTYDVPRPAPPNVVE